MRDSIQLGSGSVQPSPAALVRAVFKWVRIPPPYKIKNPTTNVVGLLLKTNPNFDTTAPPFESRGCKAFLGGAFSCQGGAKWI